MFSFSKMMRYVYTFGLLVFLLFLSCKKGKRETINDDAKTEIKTKDISELSYQEIFYLLHEENEYGIDYHGEVFGQDASKKVSLINLDPNACGNGVALQSTEGEMTIKTAVKVTFSFPGNPAKEIHRLYTVKPKETIPVGNSKLCYNGSEYIIQREVVSAGYKEETQN